MSKLQVAHTILEQLGGGSMLGAMIGAHSFVGEKNGLIFRFKAANPKGIKAVKITLTPMDTYTVDFWKIRGVNTKIVETTEHVYAEDLKRVIQDATGLYLSL